MKKFGFTLHQRLRSGADFERVYALKQRAADRILLVFGARNGLGCSRIGLSVSRKHGNAVKRSRLKRLLREAFRLSQHEIPPGLDMVLIPREGNAATLAAFQQSLKRAATKLAASLPRPAEQDQ